MARGESKEGVRERILAAAEKRFWHYGIKKTTIDEIAADADVGKGTVYLHFDGKEEIAVAIIAHYKKDVLHQQQETAQNTSIPILERIKRVLTLPIESACERCSQSEMVQDMVAVIRPHMNARLRESYEQELAVLRGLIEEGNANGCLHVDNPQEAARLLKTITLNYLPGHPAFDIVDSPATELGKIMDLVYQGLR